MNGTDSGRRDNEREYAERRITGYADRSNAALQQLALDAKAVAETVNGRRLLHWLVVTAKQGTAGCKGDWTDYYNHGRREAAEQLEAGLRRLLPRETFLEIIYPKQEE